MSRHPEQIAGRILEAVRFSAEKHRDQRRKGEGGSPYINHPVEVAERLWNTGGVRDPDVIVAALLHDTLEDTETDPEEIRKRFGEQVLCLVREMTDDKQLPKLERKRLQIEHARRLSPGAKQIKLADKACNVRDIAEDPPADWPLERKRDYLLWAGQVVDGLRGVNPALEREFDAILADARNKVETVGREAVPGNGRRP
jgi:GTP diphosphokinase / guanosine-3',5'-bis(diphosphate) 3'-diphosphatase